MSLGSDLIKIKFCGLKTEQDIDVCKKADYIGFIVEVPGAKRSLTLKRAAELVKYGKQYTLTVAVTNSLDMVPEICDIVRPDIVQIHTKIERDLDFFQRELQVRQQKYALTIGLNPEGIENSSILTHSLGLQAEYIVIEASENGKIAGGSGKTRDWGVTRKIISEYPHLTFFVAGGINPTNLSKIVTATIPKGIDVSSGIENPDGTKSLCLTQEINKIIKKSNLGVIDMQKNTNQKLSDYPINGMYGEYGGAFAPEILLPALKDLEKAYTRLKKDQNFLVLLNEYNRDYGGRPTPLYLARRLSQEVGGAKIYLKREDLCHGGAHKFNNVMGQGLIARTLGKNRLIAETGAGQHGVATAMIGAVLGLETVVFMGKVDMERQKPNVQRMELLGAQVVPVTTGSQTLKDAINEALREWVRSVETTHYLIGSVVGPHPFPQIVRDLQSVIGREIKTQFLEKEEKTLPDVIVACVGGGSNAAGTFYPFIDDFSVRLVGAEAGGKGDQLGENCGTLNLGKMGILHGAKSYVLQQNTGQIEESYSISAGLDYPGVGPEHSFWMTNKRVEYQMISDVEALEAFHLLTRKEGIIPALESAHAISLGMKIARTLSSDESVVITLSGRGDKDLSYILNKRLRSSNHGLELLSASSLPIGTFIP